MSKDPTFRELGAVPSRSERYEAYRHEWDRREADMDAADHPVHVDLETVAVCDLRCGSSEEDPQGFCQIWTHEHIRTQGFDEHTYQRGYMDPVLYGRLVQQCADAGVSSIKLNYRGEPSMHPRIVSFVREAAALGFPDIMMNTNGDGGWAGSGRSCSTRCARPRRPARRARAPRTAASAPRSCARTSTPRPSTPGGWRSSGGTRWGSTGSPSRSATSPPAPSTTGRRRTGGR